MFGRKPCPSKAYVYACKAPTENLDLVEEQIRLKHMYRNKRVEIVLARLAEKDELMRSLSPELADVSQKVKDLDEKIKALCDEQSEANGKSKKRPKDEASKARRAEIKTLKADKTELYDQLKGLRHAFYENENNLSALKVLDDKYIVMEKAARSVIKKSGIHWVNYTAVERAIPLDYKVSAIKQPPTFVSFGSLRKSKITEQLHGGWPAKLMVSNPSKAVWMTPCEDSDKHYDVHMRICIRNKEWKRTTVRARIHRPLPEGSLVKEVSLVRKKVATHFKWFVQFIVAQETGFKAACAKYGSVDVKFAVKKIDAIDGRESGGVRVATWEGSDGESGEIVLPEGAYVARRRKVEDLDSIRKQNFNETIEMLMEWKKKNEKDLPEWFVERTRSIHQWKAPARLAALVLEWRKKRMGCDKGMFDNMENWRKQDKHLYEWAANQIIKACSFRKNMFRQAASDLAQKYKKIIVPQLDLGEDKKKSKSDKEKAKRFKGQQWYMFIAAPGELRVILKERFAESGSESNKESNKESLDLALS